jgi:hypothetical protein
MAGPGAWANQQKRDRTAFPISQPEKHHTGTQLKKNSVLYLLALKRQDKTWISLSLLPFFFLGAQTCFFN